MPVRVLTSPCSFKESLTATQASSVLARVARELGADVDEAPLADGGEGTLDALTRPLALRCERYDVGGMLGGRVVPRVGWRDAPLAFGGGPVAVLEVAEVVGLALVQPHARDPWRATTRGLGELLAHVVDRGARTVLVGLGGSATVDGGAGLLEACPSLPEGVSLFGLVDVDVPLAGARMFMRQKLGPVADPDAAVEALAARLDGMFAPAVAAVPGAGAAGGLGAALVSLGGVLVPGAGFVMDALDLDPRIAGADVVLTGEGAVDAQTARGKLVSALAARCARRGTRLVAFCGADRRTAAERAASALEVVVITPAGQPLDEALRAAADNLAAAARRVLTGA